MRRVFRVSPQQSRALSALALVLVASASGGVGCAQSHASPGDGGARDTGGGGGTCAVAADCTLLPASCCGACGAATASDMVAVRNEDVEANRARACAGGVGCPECFMQ
ncbi:MAG: hypothetical protein R3B40_25240, partial [Polyangiales bacterium]